MYFCGVYSLGIINKFLGKKLAKRMKKIAFWCPIFNFISSNHQKWFLKILKLWYSEVGIKEYAKVVEPFSLAWPIVN